MENENFIFYRSWLEIICQHIPDQERQNIMIRAIVNYGISGVKEFPEEEMFLEQVYAQIDSAKEKRQKRVEAGRKGGFNGKGVSRNKGNSNAKKKNNSKTIANENENVNEKVMNHSHDSLNHSSLDALGSIGSNDKKKKKIVDLEGVDFDDE